MLKPILGNNRVSLNWLLTLKEIKKGTKTQSSQCFYKSSIYILETKCKTYKQNHSQSSSSKGTFPLKF